jgi:hypothetical protein
MKVLIVSFDRSLVGQLKNALSEYEVMDVKNGEEALSLANPYFDVIIYDAMSGALSEEDINNMYQQKFKDSKFVVLVDELFPINAQNLKPQEKMLIPRESAPDQILSAITAPVQETEEYQIPTLELEIETHKQTVKELDEAIEITPSEQEKLFFEEELKLAGAHTESKDEVSRYTPESVHLKKKVAVVSFDSTLVDSITSLLSENFEPVVTRSFRDLEILLKNVDGVIFDAISGLTAKKRLIELAKDQDIAQKPFLVLIDELFNIRIDDIPLRKKQAISREEDPKEIVEKVKEFLTLSKEEETTLMQMPKEFLENQVSVQEKEEDAETEEFPQITKELEMPKLEESPSPVKEFVLEEQEEEPTPIPQIPIQEAVPTLSALEQKTEEKGLLKGLSIRQVVEEAIKEEIKRAFEGFNPNYLVGEILKEELKKRIESIPLESIIREATYQVLRERLRELIT